MERNGRRLKRYLGLRREAGIASSGGIEHLHPSLISGWVVARGVPLQEVRLLVGPHLIARAEINQARPDVCERLGWEGTPGFSLVLPADLPPMDWQPAPRLLAISADGSQKVELALMSQPEQTTGLLKSLLQSELLGLEGHFDGLLQGELRGWAGRRGQGEPVKIWLQTDGQEPWPLNCNQMQDGLKGMDLPEHSGFYLELQVLPPSWGGREVWCSFDQQGQFRLPQDEKVTLPTAPTAGGEVVHSTQSCYSTQSNSDGCDIHDRVDSYQQKAQALLREKKPSLAREVLAEALSEFPCHSEFLELAISAHEDCNDSEAALQAANDLIRCHPDRFEGYFRASLCLNTALKYQEAIEVISAGLKKLPDQPWLLHAAMAIHSASGNDEAACDIGDKIHEKNLHFFSHYTCHVNCLYKLKRVSRAEEVINAAFARHPNEIDIIRLRLNLLCRNGESYIYRNWLYLLAMEKPEYAKEFIERIHKYELLSAPAFPTTRSRADCDVCCLASDEAPYIAEFIHHYLYLGFRNIFVGINNNHDETDLVLRKICLNYPNVHVINGHLENC